MTKPVTTKKGGRPSRSQELVTHKKIATLKQEGKLPLEIAEILKINKNTAYHHFNQLLHEERKLLGQDFIEQQKKAKDHCVLKIEEIIARKEQLAEILQKKVDADNNAKGIEYTIGTLDHVLEGIGKMEESKAKLIMEPTLDVSLEKMILEKYSALVKPASET